MLYIYNVFLIQLLKIFDKKINKMIMISTFKSGRNNRYIINYFMAFLFLFILDIILFLGVTNTEVDAQYLNNYTKCLRTFNIEEQPVYPSESIGWYPTFSKNLNIVANLSALLSISFTFRSVRDDDFWMRPSRKERIIRIVLSCTVVVCIVIIDEFRHLYQISLDKIGIRSIFIQSALSILLFAIPLGIFPKFVFKPIQERENAKKIQEFQANLTKMDKGVPKDSKTKKDTAVTIKSKATLKKAELVTATNQTIMSGRSNSNAGSKPISSQK